MLRVQAVGSVICRYWVLGYAIKACMSVVRLPCRNWASPANDMRAQSRFTHMQSDSRPPLGQGIGRARGKHVHITWQILHTALAILLGYACIEYSRLSNSLSLSYRTRCIEIWSSSRRISSRKTASMVDLSWLRCDRMWLEKGRAGGRRTWRGTH